MAFVASDSGGGDFKRVPAGVFVGRCCSLIDLGTQFSDGIYGPKSQHKIRLSWELFGEDDDGVPLLADVDGTPMPMTISKSYVVSLHEKSSLRRDLAAWRGKNFTDEEAKAFDVAKLLGVYGMVNVTHSESGGKTYANVNGLTPLPSALRSSKPNPVHSNIVFDLDKPDLALFERFYDKLKEDIKKSPEWLKFEKSGGKAAAPAASTFDGSGDDDIPF